MNGGGLVNHLHFLLPPDGMLKFNFAIRENTQDLMCYREVFEQNQYRLQGDMSGMVVVDVGANIGAFSVACLLRGAEAVIAFEPDRQNFHQLVRNTAQWSDRFVGYNAAVWRSDIEQKTYYVNAQEAATACGIVFHHANPKTDGHAYQVENFPLDKIIDSIGRRISLLKVDAEFSEYGILYTSKKLDLVDSIVVETHESTDARTDVMLPDFVGKSNCREMESFLKRQRFAVQSFKEGELVNGHYSNHLLFGERFRPIITPENPCQSQRSTSSSHSSPTEATEVALPSTPT